ncbi:hypothetical protein Pfo_023365 [Paulownia fortunei]|nr:hypothetical protein Pfo_023365 [Paulownia fortunei]
MRNLIQQAISKILESTAQLANLLLFPIFSNQGQCATLVYTRPCQLEHEVLTALPVGIGVIVCCLICHFSDTELASPLLPIKEP